MTMKITRSAGAIFTLLVVVISAQVISASAADDPGIERMATCQDSWLEWKNEPVRLAKLADSIRSSFVEDQGGLFLVPKSKQTILGLPVLKLFPESIGMALGFSVMVDADFEATRKSLEGKIGKSLKKCDTADNMRSCELEIGEKKTILLISGENGKSKSTLFGCFYYYEK